MPTTLLEVILSPNQIIYSAKLHGELKQNTDSNATTRIKIHNQFIDTEQTYQCTVSQQLFLLQGIIFIPKPNGIPVGYKGYSSLVLSNVENISSYDTVHTHTRILVGVCCKNYTDYHVKKNPLHYF